MFSLTHTHIHKEQMQKANFKVAKAAAHSYKTYTGLPTFKALCI